MRTLMYIFTWGINIIHKNIHYYVSLDYVSIDSNNNNKWFPLQKNIGLIKSPKKRRKRKIIIEINFNYVKDEKKWLIRSQPFLSMLWKRLFRWLLEWRQDDDYVVHFPVQTSIAMEYISNSLIRSISRKQYLSLDISPRESLKVSFFQVHWIWERSLK